MEITGKYIIYSKDEELQSAKIYPNEYLISVNPPGSKNIFEKESFRYPLYNYFVIINFNTILEAKYHILMYQLKKKIIKKEALEILPWSQAGLLLNIQKIKNLGIPKLQKTINNLKKQAPELFL